MCFFVYAYVCVFGPFTTDTCYPLLMLFVLTTQKNETGQTCLSWTAATRFALTPTRIWDYAVEIGFGALI